MPLTRNKDGYQECQKRKCKTSGQSREACCTPGSIVNTISKHHKIEELGFLLRAKGAVASAVGLLSRVANFKAESKKVKKIGQLCQGFGGGAVSPAALSSASPIITA